MERSLTLSCSPLPTHPMPDPGVPPPQTVPAEEMSDRMKLGDKPRFAGEQTNRMYNRAGGVISHRP